MNQSKIIDWASSLGICLAHIGNYIYIPLLLSKLGSHYSGFWAGLVLFMTYFGRVNATFFYQFITNNLSIRNIIVLFVLVEATALLGMGFFESRQAYLLLAYFIGFGSGISFPALKHLLATLPEEYRLTAFSRFQLAAQGGLVLGAILGGLLIRTPMTHIFITTFVLFVGYASVIFIYIPNTAIQTDKQSKTPFIDFSLFKNANFPQIKYDLLLSMFYWILIMGFMVNIPLHIQAYLPSISISMPFWLTGIVLLLLQMPLSKHAEKWLGTSSTMLIGCVFLMIAFMSLSMATATNAVVLACIMIALGQILFAPALDLHVSRNIGKEHMGKAMSAMHFYRSLGNMTGCFTAGILFDLSKSMHIQNLAWITMSLIASFLAVSCIILNKFKVSQ